MKSYIKGFISGAAAVALISAMPAVAQNIDAYFNTVRINVDGVDAIQWNDEIELSDGTTAPTSIIYNGTTYLPMRKLSELFCKTVYWNGDSKTVSVTGAQENKRTVAEKADAYGNMWQYYTFNDEGKYYLGVKDEDRGYERVYRMISDSVRVTDDGIYFSRITNYHLQWYMREADVMKITFKNDKNSQDGETVEPLNQFTEGELAFDGDYVYYTHTAGGTNPHEELCAVNYISGGKGGVLWYPGAASVSVKESDDSHAVLSLGNLYDVEYDKTTGTFGEKVTVSEKTG